jgi:hypothetical protein
MKLEIQRTNKFDFLDLEINLCFHKRPNSQIRFYIYFAKYFVLNYRPWLNNMNAEYRDSCGSNLFKLLTRKLRNKTGGMAICRVKSLPINCHVELIWKTRDGSCGVMQPVSREKWHPLNKQKSG